jgi:hypothetical protein
MFYVVEFYHKEELYVTTIPVEWMDATLSFIYMPPRNISALCKKREEPNKNLWTKYKIDKILSDEPFGKYK